MIMYCAGYAIFRYIMQDRAPREHSDAAGVTLTSSRQSHWSRVRLLDGVFAIYVIVAVPAVVVTYVSLLWLPAVIYRWSIKGTAWIYLPLLWIIHSAKAGAIHERLRDIRNLLVNKLATLLGLVAVLLVVFRWVASPIWSQLGDWMTRSAPLLAEFIQPHAHALSEIPKWQLASAVNGALAIALFLFADTAVFRSRDGRPIKESLWGPILRTVWPIRTTLSVYSIAANTYIAASLVERYGLPKIGAAWVPAFR